MSRYALSGIHALIATLGLAWAAPAQQSGDDLRWRVPGAADALEETALVRILVAAELDDDQASPTLGIVQTAACLFTAGEDGEPHPLEHLAAESGLLVRSVDEELLAPGAPVPLEATIEPPPVARAGVAVDLLMGRPLPLVGVSAAERASLETPERMPVGSVRVDPAELEDRRRWAPETIVPPGKVRTVWQGAVPLTTNRLYADYLVVRPARVELDARAGVGTVRDTTRTPEGGILDMPTRPTSVGAPTAVRLGPALARPDGPRVFEIDLRRGVLNEVRLRAFFDPAGGYALDIEVIREPLRDAEDGAAP